MSWPARPVPRTPSLDRINPLTSAAVAVTAVVISTAVGYWALSLGLLLAAGLVTVLAGTARRVWPASALILLPLAASLLLTHGFFFPEGSTELWSWGPARLTVEGLTLAGNLIGRAAVLVVILLTLSFSIRPADIMALCSRYRIPAQLGFVLSSTLTIAPGIVKRVQRIREAQQLRGLSTGTSFPARLASFRLLAVPLLLSLLHDAGERSAALEARGFGGPTARSSLRTVPDSALQFVVRWAVLGGLAVFLFLWFSPGGGGNAP